MMENSVASSAVHRTDRQTAGLHHHEHLASSQPMLAPPIAGDRTGLAARNQRTHSVPRATYAGTGVANAVTGLVIARAGAGTGLLIAGLAPVLAAVAVLISPGTPRRRPHRHRRLPP